MHNGSLPRLIELLDLVETGGQLGIFDYLFETDSGMWSAGEARLYGMPQQPEGLSWERWRTFVVPEDYAAFVAAFEAAVRERREVVDYTFRIVRPDGARRWLGGYARIQYGADGKPKRMFGINRDITEKKAAEERLREAEAHKLELIGRIAAELAHATRGMRQALEVAKRQGLLREPFTCAQLEQGIDFLERMTEELRGTADASWPSIAVITEPFPLERALNLALQNAAPFLQRGGQRVAVCSSSEPAMTEGDCVRLAQVLTSLLLAAAAGGAAGGSLCLSVAPSDERVRITIAADEPVPGAAAREFQLLVPRLQPARERA